MTFSKNALFVEDCFGGIMMKLICDSPEILVPLDFSVFHHVLESCY